ncbi:hypothetical protein [Ochrobactrum quorumnocens]|uniref:Uncharacterized protein n=1 Tax=Ochrobactrum quorumnocens TaxID=271865 RepID=A0A5N1K6M6_9HYPH|nr:hypothetical protein [[Ochrobactrum] quorumnocens]KAA9370918.1 hypothetical protein F3W84_00405 [[Ochrobactrum] quorumnocens]
MAKNDLKLFAGGSSANIITQAEYEAMASLINGFSTGVAQSRQLNKVWRQASFISAMIGQFTMHNALDDVLDDGDVDGFEEKFRMGLQNLFPKLQQNGVILFVRTDGSDSNDGSDNTGAKAFRTIAAAIDYATSRFYITDGTLTIQIGVPGSYSAPGIVSGSLAKIRIIGDAANQANYIISGVGPAAGQSGLISAEGSQVSLEGLTINNTGSINSGVGASGSGSSMGLNNVTVTTTGTGSFANVFTVAGGNLVIGAGCIFKGNATAMLSAQSGAISISANFNVDGGTYSVVASATTGGSIQVTMTGLSITGSCSGTRYYATLNGVINTSGAGTNFFPGTAAGQIDRGGQYA